MGLRPRLFSNTPRGGGHSQSCHYVYAASNNFEGHMTDRQQINTRRTCITRCSSLPLLLVTGFWMFLTVQTAHAERRYTLSAQLDLVGGVSNSLYDSELSISHPQHDLTPFYSATPSLGLNTEGRNFDLSAYYGYSYQRYQRDEVINIHSHTADVEFRSDLSEYLHLILYNHFYSTPDYITAELTRNIVITDEGFDYAYIPEPSRFTFKTDNAQARLNWDIAPQSYLTFMVGGGYRDYQDTTESVAGIRSDQVRYTGSMGFSNHPSQHFTWNIRYLVTRNQYLSYGTSLSHSGLVGFSYQLRPTVQLSFEAGPSYVTSSRSGTNYLGYAGTFRLVKSAEFSQFFGYASHRSGDSSGIGHVSDIDVGGLGFSFQPARRINVALSSSAYRSRQRKDDPLNTWGVYGGMHISLLLNRFVQLGGGATYRRTEGHTSLDREYKQFYGSISFIASEFWDTMR
jgi:hypothetical protein